MFTECGTNKSLRWMDMILKGHVCGYVCSWAHTWSYLWFWEHPTKSLYFEVGKSVTYIYLESPVRSSEYNFEIRKPAGKISEIGKQTVSSTHILSLWELNACWIQLPKQLMSKDDWLMDLWKSWSHCSTPKHHADPCCVQVDMKSSGRRDCYVGGHQYLGRSFFQGLAKKVARTVDHTGTENPSKQIKKQKKTFETFGNGMAKVPKKIALYGVLVVALARFPGALIDLLLKDWVIPPWHVTTCRGKVRL